MPRRASWAGARLVALPVLLCSIALALAHQPDDLPGWQGEMPQAASSAAARQAQQRAENPVEVISWEPRAFVYHGLLSDEECDHLIETARPRMKRSGVVDVEDGGATTSELRTSSGTFFPRGKDEIVAGIERKIAAWTLINETQGEGIQVLQYEETQKYDAHYDYFFHDQANHNGGNRMATVLMYLTDVEFGGETVFPKADIPPAQAANSAEYSECGMSGLAIKPKKGDALLFFSLKTTGELEQKSFHAGCPVVRGEKWSATKWIHVSRVSTGSERPQEVQHKIFAPPQPPIPPGCVDHNKQCRSWAMQGECESNPTYMLGQPGVEGGCLASCNACHLRLNAQDSGSVHDEIRRHG